MPSTLLLFDKLHNIRDLGGMSAQDGRRIRPGRLIRCGHLADLVDSDRDRLAGMLGVIVDFRTEREKTRQPDLEIPGTRYYHIPIVESLTAGITREKEADTDAISLLIMKPREAREYMCQTYRTFALSDYALSQYARFIRILLENGASDRAVLWHCTAGKDRAGIGALLVEELLGVPRKEVLADYLYTRECLAEDIESLTHLLMKEAGTDSPLAKESLGYLFGAEEEFIEAFMDAVENKYGDLQSFFRKGLKISEKEQLQLQAYYLE